MQKGKTHRSPFLVNIIKVQSFSIFFHIFIKREIPLQLSLNLERFESHLHLIITVAIAILNFFF
jgi:hypothetical protein